jgi:hypothetical protein
MASLSVLRAREADPVESAVLAPLRVPAPGDRQGPSGREPAGRDRVTISAAARDRALAGQPLDEAQLEQVAQLRSDDGRVRAHERAHQAAGGAAAGGASFRYVKGPDGKLYAVAGEVPIRFEPGRTPDETIANAERMRAAALAPADPSPQDLAVAAQAMQLEQNARARKQREGDAGASSGARRAVAAYAASGGSGGAGAAPAAGSLLAVAA